VSPIPGAAETDPLIRRLERWALIWCGLAAAAALAIRFDDPSIAAGVLGGGVLTFISLFAIRGSIDAVLRLAAPAPAVATAAGDGEAAEAPAPLRVGPGIAVKLVGRYALLALAAYVMIVRLRLHAVGVVIGASSLVAAATVEAVRGLRR
jgi:hypothetical protein